MSTDIKDRYEVLKELDEQNKNSWGQLEAKAALAAAQWTSTSSKSLPEKDPNGVDAHSPGSKLDAGKAEYDMVLYSFPDALAHVDRIGKFGARKYTKGGFLDVPNGQARYFNAEIRHAIKRLRGEANDPDSEELHLAHKAWNALAELQLFLEGKGN